LKEAMMTLDITAHPPATPAKTAPTSDFHPAFIAAWFLCLVFYFMQYAVRSAPSVMVPELTAAFGLTTLGVSSLLGLYYYTYSTFAIVAGASLDRWGAKYTIPVGVFMLAIGIAMFGLGISWAASFGRLLQGAGAAFAFTGAVYLATHGFPAKWLATAVGFTQCLGMLGGSAGQFAVAPLVHGPITWQQFWIYAGIVTLVIALGLLYLTPRREDRTRPGSVLSMFAPYKIVLTNPQSYLCGLSSGLLFLPTTVGGMIFGVSFLRLGWHLDYAEAVNRASMIPLGWVFGAPILGYLADHFGRRKPVLFAGIALMLVSIAAIMYMPPNSLPPYVLGFLLGFGSGAAMIPYSIIKEVNPDEVKGSATGAINFLVFTMSAFGAPLAGWVLQKLSAGAALSLPVFQIGGAIAIAGIAAAGILAIFLRETGWAANKP
jgi:MFS family permease